MSRSYLQEGTLKKWLPLGLLLTCYSQSAYAQISTVRPVSPREFFFAFCLVVILGIAANAFLVSLVRPNTTVSNWQKRFEFSPADLGSFSWQSLALWSLLSLFMELLMIRWISSEIRIFAYFKKFVLIACFLGFGLGCYLSRRRTNLLLMLVPLLVLAGLVQAPWLALRSMVSQLPVRVTCCLLPFTRPMLAAWAGASRPLSAASAARRRIAVRRTLRVDAASPSASSSRP